MKNKDTQMIRDYMNLMESTEKNIISESVITPLLTQAFKGFSKSVSLAVENSIKKVLDDVVIKSAGKTVTMATIRNNQNYKQAIIQSVEEAARARHKMTFADLSKKLPNEADKLVSEVDGILKKDLETSAKAQGKSIASDLKSSEKVLQKTQSLKAAGAATKEDLKQASKNWETNVKLQSKSADAKRALSGMNPLTRKQVDNIIKQAKITTQTGSQISGTVKAGGKKSVQLPASAGGGFFKLTKEQLAKLPGSVTKVIVTKGMVKGLITLGVSVGVLYLLYQTLFPNDSIIIEDENGNDVDFGGSDFAPCVKDLVDNKSGKVVTTSGGQIFVHVVKTGNQEYDNSGGLKFYSNGRVFTYDNTKRGSWSCEGGVATIAEISNLNEQGDNMPNDVDKMIDLLDFPVSQSNLISAKDLLQKYVNSGQGKKFLNLYQKSGLGGGDLSKTLDYIYTVNATSVQAKEDIRDLIKKAESGGSGGDENKITTPGDLSGIQITWDSEKKSEDGKKEEEKPIKPKYRDCTDFTYVFGCKSPIIKEVQKCLGMPTEYQTGNFGPLTLQYLETKRGEKEITKEVYDSIMKNCKQSIVPTGSTTGDTITQTGSTTGDTITQTGSTTGDTITQTTPTQQTQEIKMNRSQCVNLFSTIDDSDQEQGTRTATDLQKKQIQFCLQQYNFGIGSGAAKIKRRYGFTSSGGERGIK